MAESRSSPEMYKQVRGDLMEILQEVGVHKGWMPMFQENPDLLDLLRSSISQVEKYLQRDGNKPMIPERSKLLLALSRCPPKDVKVVILGHYPMKYKYLSTGFAFSFPKGTFNDEKFKLEKDDARRNRVDYIKGESLAELHRVLVQAGYLEEGANYDGCHEVWAENGVLLLEASLTYDRCHQHFPMWQDFVSRLLCLVPQHSEEKPVFFLCWGDNAKAICEQLVQALQLVPELLVQIIDEGDHSKEVDGSAHLVVFIGHHPTWPRDGRLNQFNPQATNQFKAIKTCYPNLFELPKLIKEESTQEFPDESKEKS